MRGYVTDLHPQRSLLRVQTGRVMTKMGRLETQDDNYEATKSLNLSHDVKKFLKTEIVQSLRNWSWVPSSCRRWRRRWRIYGCTGFFFSLCRSSSSSSPASRPWRSDPWLCRHEPEIRGLCLREGEKSSRWSTTEGGIRWIWGWNGINDRVVDSLKGK